MTPTLRTPARVLLLTGLSLGVAHADTTILYESVDGTCTVRATDRDIIFNGCNILVRNGDGSTPTANGYGNVIIGYNSPSSAEEYDRSGSHNLVIGDRHEYGSYAGLVTGYAQSVLAPYGATIGGRLNVVEGTAKYAATIGGQLNTVEGAYATVTGGANNTASGTAAAVAGGKYNDANGTASVVSGGYENAADGTGASVSGGRYNNVTTEAYYGAVSGGKSNAVTASYGSVTGGSTGTAGGTASTVCGGIGGSTTAAYETDCP